jgi:signal transduction histidine kinase
VFDSRIIIRMNGLVKEHFVRRRVLWIGFLAVLLPLTVLLVLQYRWLVRLEKTSAYAEKAWLKNYLEAVSEKVEYTYRKQAERGLNIPIALLAHENPEKLSYYMKKKHGEGAKYLFVLYDPPGAERKPTIAYYDPVTDSMGPPADHETMQAIWVALAPWTTMLKKGAPLSSHALAIDERDPNNRIILNPLSDDSESCTMNGVAGMVVDNDYFEKEVLPGAIKHALPKFFDRKAQDNLVIAVHDGTGRLVLGSEVEKASKEVWLSMPFIYSDWKLVLGSRHTTPEQWAKTNFMINMSLSVLLGVVLLGGIALALRTASRAIYLSQMKADFVSNVSHELRTPLASIRVFGEFLRLGRVEQPGKIREYGEFIETESRRLTQLINNILDFSKIESGAKTYQFDEVDLSDVMSDTLRSLEVSLKHKGFALTYESPADPLPLLTIDPDAIAQAVANLIDNAVKYSNGANRIKVGLERRPDEMVISVRDYGIGISRDEQEKIFERFHRVSTGLVHDVKGSGLGLSIVSHIVSAHGGKVEVESELGKGSTFSIHLPLGAKSRGAVPLTAAPMDQV